MSAHIGTLGTRLPRRWWLICLAVIASTLVIGVCVGAVNIAPTQAINSLLNNIPGVHIGSVDDTTNTIMWDIRFPRVVLTLIVGSMLASAGCAYQGTFRNPLADPYFLGVSAGAGLGATTAIVLSNSAAQWVLPLAAFVGAMVAVALTYTLGRSSVVGRSSTSLILAGVAVAALLTAIQTLICARNSDKVQQVYTWILGRLATAGWNEVILIAPYVLICTIVLIKYRRVLDVFSVGDEEALTLGLDVAKARAAIICAASLGTAAVVSVTGLIGFVGIIVPHTIRLVAGNSYRVVLPLSVVFGGVFLVFADIIARTALSPEEIPIGVVTALIGAPFFLYILASRKQGALI